MTAAAIFFGFVMVTLAINHATREIVKAINHATREIVKAIRGM